MFGYKEELSDVKEVIKYNVKGLAGRLDKQSKKLESYKKEIDNADFSDKLFTSIIQNNTYWVALDLQKLLDDVSEKDIDEDKILDALDYPDKTAKDWLVTCLQEPYVWLTTEDTMGMLRSWKYTIYYTDPNMYTDKPQDCIINIKHYITVNSSPIELVNNNTKAMKTYYEKLETYTKELEKRNRMRIDNAYLLDKTDQFNALTSNKEWHNAYFLNKHDKNLVPLTRPKKPTTIKGREKSNLFYQQSYSAQKLFRMFLTKV